MSIGDRILAALEPHLFETWLGEHLDETVGVGVNAVACPVSRYLDDTVLKDTGLWASSFDQISVIRSATPAVDYADEQVIAKVTSPAWTISFIKNLDGRTGLGDEVQGARALAILEETLEEMGERIAALDEDETDRLCQCQHFHSDHDDGWDCEVCGCMDFEPESMPRGDS